MPRRQYQQKREETDLRFKELTIPTDMQMAVYYRQSTEAQIGNVSTTMQTVDMVKHMEQLGWEQDKIIMIDMDAGVSGTKKIDEREGMTKLFQLINNKEIGAVACQDEDRLFRDVTQIQVNIFIEACKQNQVQVITPSMVYSFFHPQMGTHHARQFRFKCEMAAEYISTFIKGKLNAAKDRVALSGCWVGGRMAVGFMVDRRKHLPDGSVNPQWKKYELFEPYAKVVREYYRIFLEHAGCVAQAHLQIRKHGPHFPDPTKCHPPEGFYVNYQMKQNSDGWCPKGPSAFSNMLSNAAYIGHWSYRNAIVQWNNHPPLIDEKTFFKAFNYISETSLDGTPNLSFRPFAARPRPTKEQERTEEYPLTAGLVFFEWESELVGVSTNWMSKSQRYTYVAQSRDGYSNMMWRKDASFIDDVVVDLLLKKLAKTFDYDTWEQAVTVYQKQYEEQQKLNKTQLNQLSQVMENLVASLSSLTTPAMIAEVERKYQAAQLEYDRLQKEHSNAIASAADIEKMKKFRHSFSDILQNWPNMETTEKRSVVHSFVEKCVMTKLQKGWNVKLDIFWRDGSQDSQVLARAGNRAYARWLPQDTALLIKLVQDGTDRLEIAKHFPDRKWYQLADKYRYETKDSHNLYVQKEGTIKKYETYNEYVERVGLEQQLEQEEQSDDDDSDDSNGGPPSIGSNGEVSGGISGRPSGARRGEQSMTSESVPS